MLQQENTLNKEVPGFGDSSSFLNKGRESVLEVQNPDTPSKQDLKKQFIESQIGVHVAEPSRANGPKIQRKAEKVFIPDTGLLNIQLSESSQDFKFREIKPKAAQKKPSFIKTQAPKNFFGGHYLLPSNREGQALNHHAPFWEFMVILLLVSGFTIIRVLYFKTIRQVFMAAFSLTGTRQLLRDENLLVQRATVILTVLFNLIGAFFLYQVSMAFDWPGDFIGNGLGRFILFAFGLSAVYSLKFIVLRISGFIFESIKPVSAYIFNIFIINNVLGMILLPAIVCINFLPIAISRPLILGSIVLIGLAFIYRVIRGVLIGLSSTEFSGIQLFLYFCTLEFSPLVILAGFIFA